MRNQFFLDTGYLIALEAADDQHHESALKHWQNLIISLPPLVTTSYLFNGVVIFFNSRHRHFKAVEIGMRLVNSPSIQMIYVNEILFNRGWKYFQKQSDKSFPLNDCRFLCGDGAI